MNKRSLFIFVLLVLSFSNCRKVEEWQPLTKFPLLEKGKVSKDPQKSFSLSGISASTRVLVINFFAPKCEPCIRELPELNKVYEELGKLPDVEFYAIGSTLTSLDSASSSMEKVAVEVTEFMNFYKVKYPAYLSDSPMLKDFGITGFPETLILYRNETGDWYIKRRYVSSITIENVLDYI